MKCQKIGFRILIPFLILLFSIITCLNTLSIIDNNLTNTNRNLEEIKYKETLKVSSDKELYRIWGLNSIDSRYMGRSVAHDSDGNYYMVGDSYSTSSDDVAFLIKYDNDGNLQWNKIWSGEGGYPECEDVAVDSSDNIYVTGTIKKGGVYVINTLKFSKNGDLMWNSSVGGGIESMGMGIALGNDNYVYVTGFNYTGVGDTPIVLVKYNMTSGNIEDLRSYEGYGSSNSRGYDITIDLSNNIYICGTNSSVPPAIDILLLKLNSTMDLNWSKSWKNPEVDAFTSVGGVAVDSNGEIYIVGFYEAHESYFPYSFTDRFFLKYSDTGVLIFQDIFQNQYNNTGLSDIYLFQNELYICGFEGKDYDEEDAILLIYNTTGDLKEKKYWGGNDDDSSWGITVRNPSEIVIVGRTESYTDGSLQDAFILKYYSTGTVLPSGDDDDDDDDKDVIIPGYDIYLIIILITFISSISLCKKLKK